MATPELEVSAAPRGPAVTHPSAAAMYLGLSVASLYREMGAGRLPYAKAGARTLIRYADLDASLTERVGEHAPLLSRGRGRRATRPAASRAARKTQTPPPDMSERIDRQTRPGLHPAVGGTIRQGHRTMSCRLAATASARPPGRGQRTATANTMIHIPRGMPHAHRATLHRRLRGWLRSPAHVDALRAIAAQAAAGAWGA